MYIIIYDMENKDEIKNQIAKMVKNKRKSLGMTQKDLAEGICAQGIISQIEKGGITPSIEILIPLLKKLQISREFVEQLFDIEEEEAPDLFSNQIKDILNTRDYSTLDFILSQISYARLSVKNKVVYDWLDSILLYHSKNCKELALQKLNKLLLSLKPTDPFFFRVKMSLGNFYSDSGDVNKALTIYKELLPLLIQLNDWEEVVKFHYNIARSYYYVNDLPNSLKYNLLAIDLIIEHKSFLLLADCYIATAVILQKQELFDEAYKNCQKAMHIIDLNIVRNSYIENLALQLILKLKESIKNEEKN